MSVILLLWAALASAGVKQFVIGNSEHPWRDWGDYEGVDDASRPGWIQPRRTTRDVNILNELYRTGRLFFLENPTDPRYKPGDGRIWTPNAAYQENAKLLMLADGKKDSLSYDYFNRLASNNGVCIYIDLGAPYPVDEIKFYPLLFGAHQDLYMKGYELYANDGSPETQDEKGRPIFHLLDAVPTNTDVVVDNRNFPPQYIRYIKLRCTSPQPFEIDQIEVRGEGYIKRATFTSKVIDLGDIANLGALRWHAEVDPGARVVIRTRAGTDRTTLIYYRINELGELEPLPGRTDEENRKLWEALPDKAKGPVVDDTDNWTLWSPPYTSSGETFVCRGPRRFIQIQIVMESTRASSRASVDSVAVEYSQPTMARRVFGRISPNIADLGVRRTYTYTLVPEISKDDIGFDEVRIVTPTEASVGSVEVGGRPVPQDKYEVRAEPNLLIVRLLDPSYRVRSSQDTMRIEFDCLVLVYGTVFTGKVFASWEKGLLGQDVEERALGDLSVQGSEGSLGIVLGDVDASPNPFTPNGDGVHDVTKLNFKIFQMMGTAPISVGIYGTDGRPVRTLLSGNVESGSYEVPWDGRDEDGDLVPPGIYLYKVKLEGDEREFVRLGTVVVVY